MTQDAGIPPEFRTYSLEEVAKILSESGRGLTVRTLQDYCKKGQIHGVKIGSQWRVSHANLSLYLNGPVLQPNRPAVEAPENAAPAQAELQVNPSAKARAALDQLKLQLEAERARRHELMETIDPAPTEAVAEPTPVESDDRLAPDAMDQAPAATEAQDFSEVAGEVSVSRGLSEPGQTLAAEIGLEHLNRPPRVLEPACGPGPEDFLQVLKATAVLEPSPEPENSVEEEEFPGRALRMTCELAADETGQLRRHGVYESWYLGGVQAARGEYREGRLSGAWQQWHENGQVQVVGAHVDGLPDGPWTWWDEDGRKTQEISYQAGRFDGLWAQFHPNGRKWCEGRYRDGVAQGSFRYWDLEGRPA